jgi:putative transposase
MPRTLRVVYSGAIYHVMDRADRREDIFVTDVDRHDFLKTLAEACQKTGWQVHAYGLIRNHFHLVLETPNANLAEGMRWFLSTYTIRLNHRQKLFGHVFSGRYKALLVEGSGNGYLKTPCDDVHLNPARANLLGRQDRLLAYPWSSLISYLAAPEHRPGWIRVDRLLGEHGIQEDCATGRQEFERRMEARWLEEVDEAALKPFRRGWCLGSQEFKEQMIELMEGKLGDSHAGELHRESTEQKANRVIAQEMASLGWTEADLDCRLKSDPGKLAQAARVRKETTLPITWIAARLRMGTAKCVKPMLHHWLHAHEKPANDTARCAQLQLQPPV